MTRKHALLAGALSAAMIAASSNAMAGAAPEGPTPFDWSGIYAGAQVGYAFGNADHQFSNGAPSGDSKPDGLLGGAHFGVLLQNGQLVFGVEGDIEYADVSGEFNNTLRDSAGSTEIGLQGSVRARVGYAMDRFLPYVTGGLAIADVDHGGGPAHSGPCCGYSETAIGWTIGAGAGYAVTDSISARLEYRYTDYGSKSGGLSPTFPSVKMTTDLQTHAIRAGVSFHF